VKIKLGWCKSCATQDGHEDWCRERKDQWIRDPKNKFLIRRRMEILIVEHFGENWRDRLRRGEITEWEEIEEKDEEEGKG